MCGRFANSGTIDGMTRVFAARAARDCGMDLQLGEDCRPSQRLPVVVCSAAGDRHLRPARWGLDFTWAKRPLINVRAETAARKRSIAPLWQEQRCLVPATAFYEWQRGACIAFRMPSEPLFALAGLWQLDADSQGRFAICTTRPNAVVAPVHDRMPVIVPAAQHAAWLADDDAVDWCAPLPDAALQAVPVS